MTQNNSNRREKLIAFIARMDINANHTTVLKQRIRYVIQSIHTIASLPQTIEQDLNHYWITKRDNFSQLYQNLFPNLPPVQVIDDDVQQDEDQLLYEDLREHLLILKEYTHHSILAPNGVHNMDLNLLDLLVNQINDFLANNGLIDFEVFPMAANGID